VASRPCERRRPGPNDLPPSQLSAESEGLTPPAGLSSCGGLHLIRIFLGFLVLLLQEFKRDLHGIGKVPGRLWVELTTWKVKEVDE